MAQINLLKQNSGGQRSWEAVPKLLARFFLLVLILLAAYYAWQLFDYGQTEREITQVQKKIDDEHQEALAIKNRNEVLTRQLQLKTLSGLISGHIYFSQLLPELARVTLKTASYSALQTTADGNMNLVAKVPTVSDFDKYLQVFDLTAFNQNFSNIRIGGFHKNLGTPTNPPSLDFTVRMQYDPGLIKYKATK